MKEYIIAGKKFRLIDYGELTQKKESEIDSYFGIDSTKKQTTLRIERDKIFPLILEPVIPGDELKVEQMTNNQMADIIIDYQKAKKDFFVNLPLRSKSLEE